MPENTQPEKQRGYKEIEHDADWALQVWGADLTALLRNAALGMNRLMQVGLPGKPVWQTRRFELTAGDAESLLVEWLDELVFWADVNQTIFTEFDMHRVTDTHLHVTAKGCRITDIGRCIKAVTFHNLKIRRVACGLETTVVFDV